SRCWSGSVARIAIKRRRLCQETRRRGRTGQRDGDAKRAPASAIISAMTIGITGPKHRAPWLGAVVVVLIIAAIVLSICLILLGLTGNFLVDWLWFSTIGYLGVFWTTIAAEAEVFIAVFVATAIIL